jgi:hypothetical protein
MWLRPPSSECSHWRLATVSTITLATALPVLRNCKMRTIVGVPLDEQHALIKVGDRMCAYG